MTTAEPLMTLKLTPEQAELMRDSYDPVNGVLELPLPVARALADWVRRYDLRPSNQKPSFRPVEVVRR